MCFIIELALSYSQLITISNGLFSRTHLMRTTMILWMSGTIFFLYHCTVFNRRRKKKASGRFSSSRNFIDLRKINSFTKKKYNLFMTWNCIVCELNTCYSGIFRFFYFVYQNSHPDFNLQLWGSHINTLYGRYNIESFLQ